jgi:hypothetical protein
MSIEYELKEALSNAAQPAARWPSRATANRLEPQCWPEIRPTFALPAGAKVFTIGSCFARHIESHLASIGFDVPAITFLDRYAMELGRVGGEIINKYTPPSIWQELSWTKRILDRDGVVTLEDIEPFLFVLGNGNVFDMHRLQGTKPGMPREMALQHRQHLFELFSQAFQCQVCVLTLGLVESWYDKESGQYVEFNSVFQRSENFRGRLVFRRLGYRECYDYIDKTVALLSGAGNPKILVTTSPIPLSRTFTSDDVIVANTYSKSVLRAVAGDIAQAWPNVDYFPSYENVMLSKEKYVWNDDLIHVDPTFIGRVMHRVIENYVPETKRDGVTDRMLQITILVRHKRYDEARALFADIEHLEMEPSNHDLALSKMFLNTGDLERARHHIERALVVAPAQKMMSGAWAFACSIVLRGLGEEERSTELRSQFLSIVRKVPMLLQPMMSQLISVGDEDTIQMVLDFAEKELRQNDEVMLVLARAFVKRSMKAVHDGDLPRALEMSAIAVRFAPEDKHVSGVHNALSKGRLPPWILKAANVQSLGA